MQVQQRIRNAGAWTVQGECDASQAQLVLAFTSAAQLRDAAVWQQLRTFYPKARIVGCSTAGEIAGTRVLDDSLVVTAVAFATSQVALAAVLLNEVLDDVARGKLLAARLPHFGLVHLMVLSDGLRVNGSALLTGLLSELPAHVAVTGGLSADGDRFERTAVCLDAPAPAEQIVAIGFYGEGLRIGYGCLGGWDPFGPERRITHSSGNVLHQLDHEPALDLYKRYLGEHAQGLPATGLLFPLAIRKSAEAAVVRTILAVDETARTLTFAGDMPVGYRARLMRANFERLVDGASEAAKISRLGNGGTDSQLAVLISCVGRKLVLKQRIEEEVEAVRDVLGPHTVMTGFYSYGEISAFTPAARCELHNQTMTITTFAERQ